MNMPMPAPRAREQFRMARLQVYNWGTFNDWISVGFGNDLAGTCSAAAGPDRIYAFTAPSSGTALAGKLAFLNEVSSVALQQCLRHLQGAFSANRVWAYWAVLGIVLGWPALLIPAAPQDFPEPFLIAAFAMDWAGMHAVFGGFLLGVVLPRGALTEKLRAQLQPFVVIFLLPMFFTYSGLNTRLDMLFQPAIFVAALVLLGALWLWTGVGYFKWFFADLTPAGAVFATALCTTGATAATAGAAATRTAAPAPPAYESYVVSRRADRRVHQARWDMMVRQAVFADSSFRAP